VFTATNAALFKTSTSTTIAVNVKAAATLGAVTSGGKTLSPGDTLKAGDSVTLTGSAFVPGESVKVILHSTPVTLATVQADSNGAVDVTVTLPLNISAGQHVLELVGSLDQLAFPFVIPSATSSTPAPVSSTTPVDSGAAGGSSATPSSGSGLASTGATVIPLGILGLLLLGAGATLAFGGRRRRHRTH
jgi:hypothetical protein